VPWRSFRTGQKTARKADFRVCWRGFFVLDKRMYQGTFSLCLFADKSVAIIGPCARSASQTFLSFWRIRT